ncbi:hypothetical protein BC828DRAFT_385835 [Blastocladiella britannica]|nr:hypothetical protein BC828DRAFT_385835 [Blastocladiella britannica]
MFARLFSPPTLARLPPRLGNVFSRFNTTATATRWSALNSQVAKPPSRWYQSYGRRPMSFLDQRPEAPLYAILAINTGVFGLWIYAKEDYHQFRNPSWLRWMNAHFLLNKENALARPWTLVTANFSHAELPHFLINMFVLHSFGSTLCTTLGARRFMALYALSVLGTSAASLAYVEYRAWNMRRQHWPGQNSWFGDQLVRASMPRGSLGASGCVMATSVVFASLYPTSTIYLMLVLPVPAWLCVSGFIGYDMYRAWQMKGGITDVAGHLGGGAAGLTYWWIGLRRARGL